MANAILVRYRAKFTIEGTAPAGFVAPSGYINDITKVGGLNLGEEGSVTVPEWDRVTEISDGKRKLVPITLSYMLKAVAPDDPTMKAFEFFMRWFKYRASVTMRADIDITNRNWETLYTFAAKGVEMTSHKMEDQDLGTPKLGVWDVVLRPYDIKLVSSGNVDLTDWGA